MRASSEPAAARGAPDAAPDVEAAREFLRRARALVEPRLTDLVPAEDAEPTSVHAAIRWSLFAGGKRLRPALVIAAGEALGATAATLLDTACAFELVHTYSLVHDDLPAMDDDELRRGRPTAHIRFGEATAILAGDALQALAFQIVAEDERLDHPARVRLVSELARAAGTPGGMVAGQAQDLEAEARAGVTGEELESIHRRKTGALIAAAARCGAIIAGAGDAEIEAVGLYGARLGLLFQITDDLLDVTATAADLGKTPGKDARAEGHLPRPLRPRSRARPGARRPRRSLPRARLARRRHRPAPLARPPHPHTPRVKGSREMTA